MFKADPVPKFVRTKVLVRDQAAGSTIDRADVDAVADELAEGLGALFSTFKAVAVEALPADAIPAETAILALGGGLFQRKVYLGDGKWFDLETYDTNTNTISGPGLTAFTESRFQPSAPRIGDVWHNPSTTEERRFTGAGWTTTHNPATNATLPIVEFVPTVTGAPIGVNQSGYVNPGTFVSQRCGDIVRIDGAFPSYWHDGTLDIDFTPYCGEVLSMQTTRLSGLVDGDGSGVIGARSDNSGVVTTDRDNDLNFDTPFSLSIVARPPSA